MPPRCGVNAFNKRFRSKKMVFSIQKLDKKWSFFDHFFGPKNDEKKGFSRMSQSPIPDEFYTGSLFWGIRRTKFWPSKNLTQSLLKMNLSEHFSLLFFHASPARAFILNGDSSREIYSFLGFFNGSPSREFFNGVPSREFFVQKGKILINRCFSTARIREKF